MVCIIFFLIPSISLIMRRKRVIKFLLVTVTRNTHEDNNNLKFTKIEVIVTNIDYSNYLHAQIDLLL